MLVFKDWLESLVSNRHYSLQIGELEVKVTPESAIGFTASQSPEDKVVECPDEWFVRLRYDHPVVGRQQGYLHISRKGWKANQEQIKKLSEAKGQDWEEYQKWAEEHFERVEKATKKAIEQAKKNLAQLEKAATNL